MLTAQEPKQYGGEGLHWYKPDGSPCHQVPYADPRKGMRSTTLRDARKMGLYPSVGGILRVTDKAFLAEWKKEQVAKAAWEIRQSGLMGSSSVLEEDWISFVLERAEDNMSVAREMGKEIHGAIERFLSGVNSAEPFFLLSRDGTVPRFQHSEHVEAAVAALKELGVWGQPFEAERTFAIALGYGGTIDFKAPAWNGLVIADFKCVDNLSKRLNYDDRCAQLCAYAMGDGTTMHDLIDLRRLVNIYISTSEPGTYLIHEWSKEDKERGWLMFQQCFALWKTINRYDPSEKSLKEISFSKIV